MIIEGLRGVVDYKRKDSDTIILRTKCPLCKSFDSIDIPAQGLYAHQVNGKFIQNALPNLSSTQREQLLTGYCQKCWDETFKEEEPYL